MEKRKATILDGQCLKGMFTASTDWLEKNASNIDILNVFPVPDGDTGTNMLLTMRATVEAANHVTNANTSDMMQSMAKGALIGARGNSGVILSQILRGMAEGLKGKDTFNGVDFASALASASSTAYKALNHPVEGTILTVLRDSSMAAQETAPLHPDNLPLIMESVVQAARDSVAKTPTLLPVLQDAGVVDAGGQGLYIIFDGMLQYLMDEIGDPQVQKRTAVENTIMTPHVTLLEPEEPYGYYVNLVIKGEKLKIDKIRKRLNKMGLSVGVVGDEEMARIHIHSTDPGAVLHYVVSLGTLHEIDVKNMDDLHTRFLEKSWANVPATGVAIVAVAAGDGITKVFWSLGATAVIHGGQTMNPSVKDILKAVERIPQNKVIILPNNKNIILTAHQVNSLSNKQIEVIPTKSIPQGIAALLAHNYDTDMETSVVAMNKAIAAIKTIEVTRAVRSTKINGIKVKKGNYMGIIDDEVACLETNPGGALLKAIEKCTQLQKVEVATLYYGADTNELEAKERAESIRKIWPKIEVDVVYGGQQHYNYIASLE